ncbi:uncharacterized protein AMSG_04238 [Thecamonas trahens ATCC 50062]|uniref:EF-hand domain-containing protein n=1 Tax=Thecamonas trahens ATCC 50062 TaxID=461836 RepID=A0A0L0D6M8_THETB|nr:hypothetical protein AMSG_04238 [Thecamonas trahens ATCC 50062]KNC48004.1 hypothetical protein AMSG_04238 [Thecamonas trahens ATCC 50062]|eukprot:XP_013759019.1 hypothetical protein AMSG_04238 [Thecamonas trahens ATCC 50062]
MARKKRSSSVESSSEGSAYTYDYETADAESGSGYSGGYRSNKTMMQLLKENKRAITKYTFYILFLAVLVVVVNNTRASWLTYEFNERLRERFELRAYSIDDVEVTLDEQRDAKQMYIYMRDYLLPGVYETTNGAAPNTSPKTTTNEFGTILQNLRRVGAPRIRQLRMKKDTCDIKKRFQSFVDTCVGPFEKKKQDKAPYGPGGVFTYSAAEDEKVLWIERRVYTSGGFLVTLGPDLASSVSNVTYLMENGFVDVQTRLIDFRMAWYNPYLDTVSVVTIAWEFLASGGARPFSSFHTVELNGFGADRSAAFEITFEIFLWIMTAIFIALQIYSLIRQGKKYFRSGWNWVNVVLVILLLLTIAFRVATVALVEDFEFVVSDSQYVDFSKIEFASLNVRRCLAILIVMMFFRMFEFLETNTKLNQLLRTMQESGSDLALFLIVILIVIFAFVFSAQLLFAESVEGFARFSFTLSRLFRFALGDFDYSELTRADFSLGPLFFYAFIIIVYLVLINLGLAIILSAHEKVMSSVEEQRWAGADPGPLTEAWIIVKNKFRSVAGLKPVRVVSARQKAFSEADANQDGLLSAKELNNFIKKHPDRAPDLLGIDNAKQLMERYDPRNPVAFNREEARAFFSVLDERRQLLVLHEKIVHLADALGVDQPDDVVVSTSSS